MLRLSQVISMISGAFLAVHTVSIFAQSQVAVNETTNTIYVGNSSSNTISVINGATNAIVATISVDSPSPQIAVNPTTNIIYALNSKSVSVIDGATNTVTADVSVGELFPTGIAVNPITNQVYVAANTFTSGTSSQWIWLFNPATNTFTSSINVDVGDSIGSVVVDPNTNTIYATGAGDGGGYIYVANGATNTFTVRVFSSNVEGIAANPNTNNVYVGDSGGLPQSVGVGVFSGATNTYIANISTPVSGVTANWIGVNTASNIIYVNTGSTIYIADGTANAITGSIALPAASNGIAVNSTTNTIYTSPASGTNVVSVINGATNTVASTITL